MAFNNTISVEYGIHSGCFKFAGLSILEIKYALGDLYGISYFSQCFHNGEIADLEDCVCGGDELIFLRLIGAKGADRSSKSSVAKSLVTAYPQLQEIGELVKAKNLGRSESVDETIRQVTAFLQSQFGPTGPEQMLTIREVATILGCSYGEARNRMLSGRIRSVKDGRWHRTRRLWLEDYISGKIIAPDSGNVQIPLSAKSRRRTIGIKPNSMALEFLRDLED